MATLEGAARAYAPRFSLPSVWSRRSPSIAIGGRDWVIQSLFNATLKDEFEVLLALVRDEMGARARAELDAVAKKTFTPRRDKIFHELLAGRLAVTPSGEHIEGAIGRVEIGRRFIAWHPAEIEARDSILRRRRLGLDKSRRETEIRMLPLSWPIYAGEGDERIRPGGGAADPLPDGTPGLDLGAVATRLANVIAIDACDAIVDRLDEGAGAAVISIRSGAQPADPDTTATGTLLAKPVMGDPAYGAAADAAPGGRATAAAITDDSSAAATGTAGYCRKSSTNDGATPLDDLIDGNVGDTGTAGVDFDMVLNTVSIVSGAAVGITSDIMTMPES
jgi:hypothetical protein